MRAFFILARCGLSIVLSFTCSLSSLKWPKTVVIIRKIQFKKIIDSKSKNKQTFFFLLYAIFDCAAVWSCKTLPCFPCDGRTSNIWCGQCHLQHLAWPFTFQRRLLSLKISCTRSSPRPREVWSSWWPYVMSAARNRHILLCSTHY